MKILTNREVEIFDWAYILGFRAGQLERRRYSIAMLQYAEANTAGANIAITRGNISLAEYTCAIEAHVEEEA